MDFKTMMDNLIEEEIDRIKQNGEKVILKTLLKKRVCYTLIFGLIFALFIVTKIWIFAFIDLIVYFIFMYKANNAGIITELAKKSPDTPISEIIRGDMK